jgi:N-methylhydantoinase B
MGALPQRDGLSGLHSHMSNTLNTPVEAFEFAYPMRIAAYQLRDDSGGDGQYRGGNGLVRDIVFQVPTEVTLLTERRRFPPYGLQQGASGQPGANVLYREGSDQPQPLDGKVRLRANPGDRLRIASPGGGGWGDPARRAVNPDEEL